MAFNPFRKSRPEDRVLALDSLDTSPAPTPPPPVSFKTAAPPPIPPRSTSPLPPAISTSESRERRRKSNVVKKVRVLSPPQSPDDEQGGAQQGMGAAWPFNVPIGQRQEPAQAQVMLQQQQLEVPSAFPSVEDFERDGGHRAEESYTQDGPTVPETQHTPAAAAPSVPPPNPFSKTLHDLENTKQKEEELHHQEELEGAALKAGNLAKGSLDVDAFRRLLLTGKPQDGTASPLPSKSQIVSDLAGSEAGEATMSSASSVTEDTSETSSLAAGSPFIKAQDYASERRSGLAVEVTPEDLAAQDERKGGDEAEDKASESDSSVSVQIGSRGKKPPPPPPSSRHGRSILNKSAAAPEEPSRYAGDRDVNKPLPAAPSLSVAESDADSPFDREAAGKVPESDTSLDDGASIQANATGATPKRPVPAPPPRRGHARTDTKMANTALSPSRAAGHEDDAPPRSSIDSAEHGHAQTLKATGSVPAPPPPRRLTGGGRTGSGQPPNSTGTPSPGLSPSADSASLHEPEQHPQADNKPPPPSMAAPPPPPPARHGSTRRPASIHAPEGPGGVARRGTAVTAGATEGTKQREKLTAPPAPPPPRQRGSSKGSVDDHAARAVAAQHVETEAVQSGSGGNILADLEALQREVDAMRGKLG
ncbi:hypothetical protein LIA77_06432 [Sarocladium implicatum]|nr:hypothetical protein LIA77_06432 [Sarocladium implicatum]